MLLADGQPDMTYAGLVAMVLSTFGAAMAALFAWLTNRDKLRFDAEMIGLRKDVVNLQADVKECLEDRNLLRARVTELERTRGTT